MAFDIGELSQLIKNHQHAMSLQEENATTVWRRNRKQGAPAPDSDKLKRSIQVLHLFVHKY